jgi:hypothetical protein
MPNFLQIATALVEKGFSVIPIETGGKRPVSGLGATHRTRDLDTVRFWANHSPSANVGICADESTVILETDDFESTFPNGKERHRGKFSFNTHGLRQFTEQTALLFQKNGDVNQCWKPGCT